MICGVGNNKINRMKIRNILGYRKFDKNIKNNFDDCYLIFNTKNQKTFICVKGLKFSIVLDNTKVGDFKVLMKGKRSNFNVVELLYNDRFGKFFINDKKIIFYNKGLVDKDIIEEFVRIKE